MESPCVPAQKPCNSLRAGTLLRLHNEGLNQSMKTLSSVKKTMLFFTDSAPIFIAFLYLLVRFGWEHLHHPPTNPATRAFPSVPIVLAVSLA